MIPIFQIWTIGCRASGSWIIHCLASFCPITPTIGNWVSIWIGFSTIRLSNLVGKKTGNRPTHGTKCLLLVLVAQKLGTWQGTSEVNTLVSNLMVPLVCYRPFPGVFLAPKPSFLVLPFSLNGHPWENKELIECTYSHFCSISSFHPKWLYLRSNQRENAFVGIGEAVSQRIFPHILYEWNGIFQVQSVDLAFYLQNTSHHFNTVLLGRRWSQTICLLSRTRVAFKEWPPQTPTGNEARSLRANGLGWNLIRAPTNTVFGQLRRTHVSCDWLNRTRGSLLPKYYRVTVTALF